MHDARHPFRYLPRPRRRPSPCRPTRPPRPSGPARRATSSPSPGSSRCRAPLPPDERCTRDRAHCIKLASYVPDVCRTIEALARANALDAGFFARLIWKESLFDAGAVGKGAQGIAQFIPATAERRGLGDPFNPAEALSVSARYLAEAQPRLRQRRPRRSRLQRR